MQKESKSYGVPSVWCYLSQWRIRGVGVGVHALPSPEGLVLIRGALYPFYSGPLSGELVGGGSFLPQVDLHQEWRNLVQWH